MNSGDSSGYNRFCLRLIARFAFTEDPETAAETALGLLLKPFEMGLSSGNRLASFAGRQGTNDARFPYYLMVKGLADYRQGRFGEACDSSRASIAGAVKNPTAAAAAAAILAMAQREMGRTEDASRALREAVDLAQNRLPKLESGDLGEDWPGWLVAHILLREARGAAHAAPVKPFLGRSQAAPPQCVDLKKHYNAPLCDGWHFEGGYGPSLGDLPAGLQRFGGVLFDVRGLIQLSGKGTGVRFPDKVEGIVTSQKARQIHFLHATGRSCPMAR